MFFICLLFLLSQAFSGTWSFDFSVKIRLERVPFTTKRQLESVVLQNIHNLQYMGDLRLGSQQTALKFIFDTVLTIF